MLWVVVKLQEYFSLLLKLFQVVVFVFVVVVIADDDDYDYVDDDDDPTDNSAKNYTFSGFFAAHMQYQHTNIVELISQFYMTKNPKRQ